MNKLNIVCLGVKNMEKSVRFYRDGLGFKTDETSDNPESIAFNNRGSQIQLYPLDFVLEDVFQGNPPDMSSRFSGATFEMLADKKEDVDNIVANAVKYGATVAKEPQWLEWGGYNCYFLDPDGYLWEATYCADFKFDENGMLIS